MTGHGWVRPRPDGGRARCGGPAICTVCALEAVPELERLRRVVEDLGRQLERCVVSETGRRCPGCDCTHEGRFG